MVLSKEKSSCNYVVNLSYNDININKSLEKVDYVSWGELRSNCIKPLEIKKRWFFSVLHCMTHSPLQWDGSQVWKYS